MSKLWITIIFILLCLNIYQYIKNKDVLNNNSDIFNDSKNELFTMNENLSCQILLSSENDNKKEFSLINIYNDEAKLLSKEGGTSPLKKIFENESTLTLGWIATGTGSTDFILINKQSGKFARTESGNLNEIFAIASKGICQ